MLLLQMEMPLRKDQGVSSPKKHGSAEYLGA